MKKLVYAEWQRMWIRKSTWLFLCMIPMLLVATSRYLSKHNKLISKDSPDYTYANSFPIMGLAEQLTFTFNIILLIICILGFAQEIHTGQLRLIIQRSYSYRDVILAKLINVLLFTLLFLSIYFVCSYVVGFSLFDDKDDILLFFHETPKSAGHVFLYNLAYYGLVYLSLVAMVSVYALFSIISKSTTSAIGLGMAFLLFSLAYPTIFNMSGTSSPFVLFSSLPMIQYQGIAVMLASNSVFYFNLFVLIAYIAISNAFILYFTNKKDFFL
ncbi:ABC transporter permease [Metabacillus halosaccharovorans]|uniref:ABC transporter permease n=1 Tax=Metabacillus halosaccharovorans TaxID=930124 RepID=A0ABT3DD00_9BACI|nr:ABC transporter permease [Metabacillus halosaccharovorans]MCV9884577.1 ABC transporter permease [Metabacillus halosaccharovorans]